MSYLKIFLFLRMQKRKIVGKNRQYQNKDFYLIDFFSSNKQHFKWTQKAEESRSNIF